MSDLTANHSIIFTSMGFVANSPPNYAAAQAAYGDAIGSGPVITAAFVSQPLAPKGESVVEEERNASVH